jgi:RimJ/RimL family protein N-acetyltransferase
MNDISTNLYRALKNNEHIKEYCKRLKVTGTDPWKMTIVSEWKDIGKIKISSIVPSDFWALRDWWIYSLNYSSKHVFPLFPTDETLERCITNHYKNHIDHRDIIFNAWLIKEKYLTHDLDNEIIGHFFLNRCDTEPEPGLAVADNFQNRKLGTLFVFILIYITKLLGKKIIYIRTDINNRVSFQFYQKLGFKHKRDTELEIPVVNYKSVIRELEMDLKDITI